MTAYWALSLAALSAAVVGVVPALKVTGKAVQRNLQRTAAGRSGIQFGGFSSALIVVDVAFPLPLDKQPGDLDLTGLVFTWGVTNGELDYVTTAQFEEFSYYGPCGCGYSHWGRYGYFHGGYGYTYPYHY